MANALYNIHREQAARGLFSWTDTLRTYRWLVVSDVYSFDVAHQLRSSIPINAEIVTSDPIVVQSADDGYLKMENTLVDGIVEGDQPHAIILYEDTGARASDKLMAYFDTAIGLPYVATTEDFYIILDTATQAAYRL